MTLVTSLVMPVAGADHDDAAIRISHTKELLGRKYKTVAQSKSQSFSTLPTFIQAQVLKRLPAKWNHKAAAVTKALLVEAKRNRFDPLFLMAIIHTESSFNPDARGRHGEIGFMQIKPDTAAWIAKKYNLPYSGSQSLENPVENIRLGAAYFAHLRDQFKNKSIKYISAYNVGPAKLNNLWKQNIRPVEYLNKVIGQYSNFYSALPASPTAVAQAY